MKVIKYDNVIEMINKNILQGFAYAKNRTVLIDIIRYLSNEMGCEPAEILLDLCSDIYRQNE